jgi:diadenylate cyclase
MLDALTTLASRAPLTWWDVVDILLVALLIYEFLKLIRGTRAVQMALSLGLIVFLFFASTTVPLHTVNWLIRNMAGYLVFAAIVLFQSDIRRALAHFGRTPFFRAFTKPETDAGTVEEVVVAANLLASRRQGAIIVFEREIGLRNYIESGIPLDAEVSYDLLVSIFQPTAPLHDGAVIIQEGRVAAASCFLPLTVQPTLSRELGTRHRAAIGLTEENDAVAVVISEESGYMSLAVDGNIERALTADELRARLASLIVQRRPQSGRAAAAERPSETEGSWL